MTSSVPPLSSRDRYRLMLQTFPLLANYWNTDDDCLRYDELKEAIGVLSRGEQIMARFYLSVWTGENHDFDFMDAAALLSSDGKKIILTWFADPFWP
ncbi:hypothetical protein GRG90_003831 [Salmonella enterica subsp. enterica serovar Typhimurium]|nr:hypothetical protein [Salmonella enterica subsp. enterica serovar Enteritidis]EDY6680810.1 hypothetical protein [Salmonella enterica subsp. enterica serovar Typhimurium]